MARHSAEFDAFTKGVEHIMSVPKADILRREEEYRKRAALNPNKRGPKPKVKPSASPDAAAVV